MEAYIDSQRKGNVSDCTAVGGGDEVRSEAVQLYQVPLGAASPHVELQGTHRGCFSEDTEHIIIYITCLPSLLRAIDETAPETFVE